MKIIEGIRRSSCRVSQVLEERYVGEKFIQFIFCFEIGEEVFKSEGSRDLD